MFHRPRLHTILHYGRIVIILNSIAIGFIIGIGLLCRWRTAFQYGEGIIFLAIIFLGISLLSMMGDWYAKRERIIRSVQTPDSIRDQKRSEQEELKEKEKRQQRHFQVLMIVSSLICLIIGSLLQSVGR